MKKKKNIFLGLIIAASLLLTIGCKLTGSDDDDDTTTAVNFLFAVQTGGIPETVDSTDLILNFDVDPTTLDADDITVTGATKGALSGVGKTRTLAISEITVGNGQYVWVAIANPSGFTIYGSPRTPVVYKDIRVRVTYNAGTGNTSGTVPVDTTAYDFDATVTVLGDPGDLKGEIIYGATKMQLLRWNTQANGEGTMYYEGNTFTITEDITLYAIYTALRVEGPAGGLIFYDAGSTQSWGRYLEAWTADESGNYQWKTSTTSTAGTSTAIGSGYDNTYTAMTGTAHPAAEVVRNATHGGFTDWFIPSKDGLYEMCWVLHSRRWDGSFAVDNPAYGTNRVGGFAEQYYWSSSEDYSTTAWSQNFSDGNRNQGTKDAGGLVRAVRAF